MDTLYEKYSYALKWEWLKSFWMSIGQLDDKKITLKLYYAKLDDHLVIFYHPLSMFIEWKYIGIWLKNNFPNSKGKCDSGNFLKCLKALKLDKKGNKERKYILSIGIKDIREYTGNTTIRILNYNGFPLKEFSSVNQLAESFL